MTFKEFNKRFSTEEKAINHFITTRYPEGLKCNHCGSSRVSRNGESAKFYDCRDCNNTFSVFTNTVFFKTKTDFTVWLYTLNLLLNGKKGISGCWIKRETGVSYKTAWRILKQLRTAMGNSNKEFTGTEMVIEMDETYVGAPPRKGNNKFDEQGNKIPNKRGRGTKKTPVIGALNRNDKQIHAQVSLPNKDGKALSGKQLMEVLDKVCKSQSIIVTDEFKGYNIIDKKTNHLHFRVDHTKSYSEGDIYTNNLECFWSILKRGILGIYHRVSVKYLQEYVNEFCFRYNNRERNMFDMVLRQAVA